MFNVIHEAIKAGHAGTKDCHQCHPAFLRPRKTLRRTGQAQRLTLRLLQTSFVTSFQAGQSAHTLSLHFSAHSQGGGTGHPVLQRRPQSRPRPGRAPSLRRPAPPATPLLGSHSSLAQNGCCFQLQPGAPQVQTAPGREKHQGLHSADENAPHGAPEGHWK